MTDEILKAEVFDVGMEEKPGFFSRWFKRKSK